MWYLQRCVAGCSVVVFTVRDILGWLLERLTNTTLHWSAKKWSIKCSTCCAAAYCVVRRDVFGMSASTRNIRYLFGMLLCYVLGMSTSLGNVRYLFGMSFSYVLGMSASSRNIRYLFGMSLQLCFWYVIAHVTKMLLFWYVLVLCFWYVIFISLYLFGMS